MRRELILGTAGHIDHGKTSLVKALTGIDCDRLPEEKKRGITIDIGFAHLEVGGVRLGIVDVPGHERFIKNMLAGATGIDLALLVVAADDSVMPQTREHLEILKLLGIRHGVIALTKTDLVDETTLQVVELEIRQLVKQSFLENAPLVRTSAASGRGIDSLAAALEAAAHSVEATDDAGWFRMPIDRAFTVQGHGTVVTGSVVSGTLRVGEDVDWHQGNGANERVRVRSLTNHGSPVEEVSRGQRAGVNLAGVPLEAVRRGQELCRPGYLAQSQVLTVRITALREHHKPLRHRLPVRLHVGTAEVMGAVSVLDRDQIEPGATGLSQLFLEEPVTSVWGQPFVLRDSSAEATIGGGQVLQPAAGKIRRRNLEALDQLERLSSNDASARLDAAVWFAGLRGLEEGEAVRTAGVPPANDRETTQLLLQAGRLVELTLPTHRSLTLNSGRVAELEGQILQVLATLHAENPLMTTHDRQAVLARLEFVQDEPLLQAVTNRLIAAKKLVGNPRRIARADFKPKLSVNQQKLKDRIVEAHHQAGFQPPEPKDFANLAGGNAASLKNIFEVAVAEGFLIKVRDDLYLSSAVEEELRKRVTEGLQAGAGLTVAQIRDLLGATRKYAVPICEYLDRIGVTRREGDLRFSRG
jgi:selenocysteine-specific elongation factor